MADVELRVKRFRHTHKGRTYQAGETFEGSESLLKAFGDRLELVIEPAPEPEEEKKEPAKKAESKEPVKASFDKKKD